MASNGPRGNNGGPKGGNGSEQQKTDDDDGWTTTPSKGGGGGGGGATAGNKMNNRSNHNSNANRNRTYSAPGRSNSHNANNNNNGSGGFNNNNGGGNGNRNRTYSGGGYHGSNNNNNNTSSRKKPGRSQSFSVSNSTQYHNNNNNNNNNGGGGKNNRNNNNNNNNRGGNNNNNNFKRTAPQNRRSTGNIFMNQQQQQQHQGDNNHHKRPPSRANSSNSLSSEKQPNGNHNNNRHHGGNNNGKNQHQHHRQGPGGGGSPQHQQQTSSNQTSSSTSSEAAAATTTTTNGANTPTSSSLTVMMELGDVQLLTCNGSTAGGQEPDADPTVIRHAMSTLLARRMEFLHPPPVGVSSSPPSTSTTTQTTNTQMDVNDNDENDDSEQPDKKKDQQQQQQHQFVWTPHERCIWLADDRLEKIKQEMDVVFYYKPLQVNEDTRWKAKVMKHNHNNKNSKGDVNADNNNNGPNDATSAGGAISSTANETTNNNQNAMQSMKERESKAIAVLNKLSWTTLDKLTSQFVEALCDGGDKKSLSKDIIHSSMKLVVEKAMLEPHFAELYANFCSKLGRIFKAFRKTILALCQEQFDATGKEVIMPSNLEQHEKQFLLADHRKKSLALMKFIGELYKLNMLKGNGNTIMKDCLQRLLVPDDEERLECFSKLMTTIGPCLHDEEELILIIDDADADADADRNTQHNNKNNEDNENDDVVDAAGGGGGDKVDLEGIWDTVYCLAGKTNNIENGPVAPTVRIKFLLQDLVELKENGWIQRRKEEKAKTIAQIHQEVAQEQQQQQQQFAANNNNNNRHMMRSQSVSSLRSGSPGNGVGNNRGGGGGFGGGGPQAKADRDGFIQVDNRGNSCRTTNKAAPLRRVKSDQHSMHVMQRAAAVSAANATTTTSGGSAVGGRSSSPKHSSSSPPRTSVESSSTSTLPLPPPPTSTPRSNKLKHELSNLRLVEYLEPKECSKKATSMYKEYFVGGDVDDAIQTIDELVGYDSEGHTARGSAVLECGILLVMEMKHDDVIQFLHLIQRSIQDGKLDDSAKDMFIVALNEPIEFLRDIEIDAPNASLFLANIISEWIYSEYVELRDILSMERRANDINNNKNASSAPSSLEYFFSDGKPAEFAVQVMSLTCYKRNVAASNTEDDLSLRITDDEINVISDLMNVEEKQQHTSIHEWVKQQQCSGGGRSRIQQPQQQRQ